VSQDEEVLGKAYDARLMRRLLTYVSPYRFGVALAVAAIIGHSALELAPPYLTKLVIDRYIPSGDLSGLAMVAAVFLATLVGSFTLEYLQTATLQTIGQRMMRDLRMHVHGHLQQLDLRFYDRNPVGRLMTRVTTDVDVLNELFTSGVVSVFGDMFTLVGITGVLLWIDWRLALVTFSVLPLVAVMTQWFRRNVRDSYRTVRTWIARINAYLQERITGMTTVHLYRREARDFAEFDAIDRGHRDANVRSIFYYAVFYPAIELVSALAAALILWAGARWVVDDALTLGALVAFLMYAQRFFRPISDMSEKFNVLQGAMASSERIFCAARYAGGDPAVCLHAGAMGGARGHRVRARDVRVRRGRSCAERRVLSRRAWSARRGCWRHRSRQDDDCQPVAAVLRRPRGSHHHRRR
jgi:ATP-binding cassette subfamily B protein